MQAALEWEMQHGSKVCKIPSINGVHLPEGAPPQAGWGRSEGSERGSSIRQN